MSFRLHKRRSHTRAEFTLHVNPGAQVDDEEASHSLLLVPVFAASALETALGATTMNTLGRGGEPRTI